MNEQRALDELQTIKNFIQEGRSKLKDNGSHMILWGIIIPVATLGSYLLERFLGPEIHIFFWPISMGLGGIAAALLGMSQGKKKRATSFADRVSTYLWIGMLIALATAMVSSFILKVTTPLNILRPTCLLLGLAYWVHSSLIKLSWIRLVALGWWILAVLVGFLDWNTASWIMAGGTMLLSLVPGVILRKTIKE